MKLYLHKFLAETFQMQMKEVVLEDVDISKALADYITTHHIHNIVVGASNRNALTRYLHIATDNLPQWFLQQSRSENHDICRRFPVIEPLHCLEMLMQ